jgi:hypothetical protein
MDLHAELLREKPQLAEKLAFTIGGALTPATREFLARVPNARLEKPFDTGALRALVRDVLGRP